MTADDLTAHPRHLVVAGALAIAGLATALLYHVRFTPYTMVLFMMAGQGLILLAAALFLYAVWAGVRARLRSIVEKQYKAGEVVFRQGDKADRLYVIGRGQADVVRETPGHDDVVLVRLGEGQFFGEIGILGDTPRTATVRAATDLEVLSIHRSYFTSLYSYLPMLREKVLSAYQERRGRDR